jgi:transcriptional regulator with XRE-family HTH domain
MKLEEAIERAGISKNALSKQSGVSRPALMRYLSGAVHPSFETAKKLSETLGVRLDEVEEFRRSLREAYIRGVTLDGLSEPQRRVLFEGREVYVLGDDTPGAIKQAFRAFAQQNPEQVRKLTPALAAAIADSPELESKPLPITISKEEK